MPRILSVLALGLLAFSSSSSLVSASHSPSARLQSEIAALRLASLESQVEKLTETLAQVASKIDLTSDERPKNLNPADCPMARLAAGEVGEMPESHAVFEAAVGDDSGAAADKAAAVWAKITADATPGSFPSAVGIFKLLFEDMKLTMNTVSDVMPSAHTKLIHSVGSHALGTLTWDKKLPYPGLFQSGASHMVVRLSAAKDPSNTAVAAGVSLKVFRDNLPSANSFFLHSFSSSSWNFFNQNLQNHVSSKLSTFDPAKILLKKFQSASNYAFYTGLSDWAAYDEKGNETPAGEIKFPFQLILVPNADVQAAGAKYQPDGKIFTNQFNEIAPGTELYTVWIQDEPFATPYPAGKLTLNSDSTGQLTTSAYGDATLFFKHQAFEEDFQYRPDWKNTCPKPETCEYML